MFVAGTSYRESDQVTVTPDVLISPAAALLGKNNDAEIKVTTIGKVNPRRFITKSSHNGSCLERIGWL
jgi:hypothetical protein